MSMYPPIFAVASANAGVIAALGSNPVRLWPFHDAPQDRAKPYAVWQTIGGSPENCLGAVPDMDAYSIQVDVYATTASAARSAAQAIRDAVEPVAHIVAWRGESRDPDTRDYRYGFDIEWFTAR